MSLDIVAFCNKLWGSRKANKQHMKANDDLNRKNIGKHRCYMFVSIGMICRDFIADSTINGFTFPQ